VKLCVAARYLAITPDRTNNDILYYIYICSVLSGRGLCIGLIIRPEKSYRGAPQDHIYRVSGLEV